MRAAKDHLWGRTAGVSEILTPDAEEMGRWSYERVPVKDGAAPFAQAARNASGEVIFNERIPREVIDELTAAIEEGGE